MRTNTGNISLVKVDTKGIHFGRKKKKKKRMPVRDYSSDLGRFNLTVSPLSSKRDFIVNNFTAQSVQRNLRNLANG